MYVAKSFSESLAVHVTRKSRKCSNNKEIFISKCNRTSLLMKVLTYNLRELIEPRQLYEISMYQEILVTEIYF